MEGLRPQPTEPGAVGANSAGRRRPRPALRSRLRTAAAAGGPRGPVLGTSEACSASCAARAGPRPGARPSLAVAGRWTRAWTQSGRAGAVWCPRSYDRDIAQDLPYSRTALHTYGLLTGRWSPATAGCTCWRPPRSGYCPMALSRVGAGSCAAVGSAFGAEPPRSRRGPDSGARSRASGPAVSAVTPSYQLPHLAE